jgi:uncharacterized surface protein with fasciclin (FAS1) repeats
MIRDNRCRPIAAALAVALLLGGCSDSDDAAPAAVDDTADTTDEAPPRSVESTGPVESTESAGQPIETIPVEDSVLAIIRERDDLTTFAAAAEALGTETVFTQERGVTVLAPNDDAFAELGEEELDAILEDPEALAAFVSDHLAVGASTTETLVAGDGFTNASAEMLTVDVDGETITVGGATIVEGDLTADNGVVHVLDAVVVSSG